VLLGELAFLRRTFGLHLWGGSCAKEGVPGDRSGYLLLIQGMCIDDQQLRIISKSMGERPVLPGIGAGNLCCWHGIF
jgi:hypothetical protein